MPRSGYSQKGIALYLVLATLFIVFVLGTIILNFMSSQSSLTHHQVSRVQAYYAAQAALNYALDMLRKDPAWQVNTTFQRTMCASGCDIDDEDLPSVINYITIKVGTYGSGLENTREVTATVNYTR